MASARVSLCIVARNEASFVADAIASARPVVDEVVVVDTGSTDPTPEVAREAGARVVHETWPGDLARAHDLPVAHAAGEWVLSLDADEVLDPAAHRRVRELVATADHDGYSFPVRNYTYRWSDAKWRWADPLDPLTRGADGHIPTRRVRLFRRRPAYTHSGALHQTVAPAILAAGGSIGHTDVPIHHYGFLRFDRDKSPLYLDLARRQVAAAPDDPQAWADLGVLLAGDEQLPAAADAFRRAWRLGDRADAAFLLGSTLHAMEHPAAAADLFDAAVEGNPDDTSARFDRADAWHALGLAHDDLARPQDAEDAYRAALASRPDHPSAVLNLAALLADLRRLDEAEQVLVPLLARRRGADTLWSTLGTIGLRRGDLDTARRAFETALDIRPENLAARLNLGITHRRAGAPDEADRAFAAAADGLATREAASLDLRRRLPPAHREPRKLRIDAPAAGLVLSIAPALAGGGGRVLVDAVTALEDRRHLVVCGDAFDYSGQGLRPELQAAGADVVTVGGEAALTALIRRARPSVVIHHWWRGSLFPAAVRVGDERWICVGHAPLPMPHGYDAYVVNSAFNARFQGHLPPQLVHRIPNGVDPGRLRRRGPRDATVTVVALSRLDPGKFPRRLVAHLPPLDGARLLVAGFGARRHEIEPEVADLRGRVRFVGPLRSADVPSFLAAADIGLHLTETHEELCSMTLLEMLAAGLPVVAQPRGGVPEMVSHGVNGYLAADERDVARHLRDLIDDAAARERMGAASRRASRRFGMDAFRTSVRRLVEHVEAGGDAPGGDEHPAPPRRPAPAVLRPDPPHLCYLVCATPRTGSNLLCEALTSTGIAGQPEEFFHSARLRTLWGRWACPDSATYLTELFGRTATPNGVFGAKVMAGTLPALIAAAGEVHGLRRTSPADLLAAALPGLRYVWISRRDRSAQAVSWLRAEQTRCWTSLEEELPVAAPTPDLDEVGVGRLAGEIERQERVWAEFFAASGLSPVRVTYEELAADRDATTRRVVAELGIDVPADLLLAPGRLRRQSYGAAVPPVGGRTGGTATAGRRAGRG